MKRELERFLHLILQTLTFYKLVFPFVSVKFIIIYT